MDYLDYSQQIRTEILRRQDLLDRVRRHWFLINEGEKPELIAGGTTNIHYRIGELRNGLWVALREPLRREDEIYQNAESFARQLKDTKEKENEFPNLLSV